MAWILRFVSMVCICVSAVECFVSNRAFNAFNAFNAMTLSRVECADATAPHERLHSNPTTEDHSTILNTVKVIKIPDRLSLAPRDVVLNVKIMNSASVVLKRLGKYLVGISNDADRNNCMNSSDFNHLCSCAFIPLPPSNRETLSRNEFDVTVENFQSLTALSPIPDDIISEHAVQALNHLSSYLSRRGEYSPQQLTGLLRVCDRFESILLPRCKSSMETIRAMAEDIELPFKILDNVIRTSVTVQDMIREIPFQAEKITTKDGKVVSERRETCWMAEPNIGGLAYSGKIMIPVPFSPLVATLRDEIEDKVGVFFDCCLINHYPDGECACKFHSDPDHGRLWGLDTIVLSIGETRRFNFRKIPSHSPTNSIVPGLRAPHKKQSLAPATATGGDRGSGGARGRGGAKEEAGSTVGEHHSFHLFHGDAVYMFGDCQEAYQHCVMKGEGPRNAAPRVSIVFKKSLPGPGGKRGHGIPKAKASSGPLHPEHASKGWGQGQGHEKGQRQGQGKGQGGSEGRYEPSTATTPTRATTSTSSSSPSPHGRAKGSFPPRGGQGPQHRNADTGITRGAQGRGEGRGGAGGEGGRGREQQRRVRPQ